MKVKKIPWRTIGLKKFVWKGKVARALSGNLYSSRHDAMAELIYNAFDACRKKGLPVPEVDIFVMPEQNNEFNGEAIVVIDYGCGFKNEADWEKYFWIGESPYENDSQYFGKNGIGKFAALYFADEYTIVTCPDNNEWVDVVKISLKDIENPESAKENHFLSKRGDRSIDPRQGSFTAILIENVKVKYPARDIEENLPNRLPISEWTIRVNGKPLKPRKIVGNEIVENIPDTAIGSVHVRLGVSEKSSDVDKVILLGGERPICNLFEIEKSDELPRCLFHPSVFGTIDVPLWKKEAAVHKRQLRGEVLHSDEWKTFVEVMEVYVRPKLEERISKTESGSADQIIGSTMNRIADIFERTFGPPDLGPTFSVTYLGKEKRNYQGRSDGPGVEPVGTTIERKQASKGGGDGEKLVELIGPDAPKTAEDIIVKEMERPKELLIRIQNDTYQVQFYPTADLLPATIKPGKTPVITVSTVFPRYKAAIKRGQRTFQTYLEDIFVEAHVRRKNPSMAGPGGFLTNKYEILNNLRSREE